MKRASHINKRFGASGRDTKNEIRCQPLTSGLARIPYPSVKIGPGDLARSHTADEYIVLDEIKDGIETYIWLLDSLKKFNI